MRASISSMIEQSGQTIPGGLHEGYEGDQNHDHGDHD
jgi:hypothetical protein